MSVSKTAISDEFKKFEVFSATGTVAALVIAMWRIAAPLKPGVRLAARLR